MDESSRNGRAETRPSRRRLPGAGAVVPLTDPELMSAGAAPRVGLMDPDQLAEIVDASPAGLVVVDESGIVTYANATARDMLGASTLAGEQLGLPLARRRTSTIELRTPSGGIREVQMQVTRVRADGRLVWLATLHDLGPHSRREASMREALRRGEDLVELTSRELRVPLNAMTEATEALADRWDRLPPIRRLALLRRIVEQSSHMDDTITRVLDATGLDAGLFLADPQPTSVLDAVLDGLPRLPSGLAAELDVRVTPGIDAAIAPSHLWTVISNLLVNAARFAPGAVRLEAGPVEGGVEIAVADAGPGIAEDERSRIFERYMRLEADQDIPGLGLGLWIVRSMVEAYGGSVRAEAPGLEGRGIRLVVRLPQPQAGPV